MTTGKARAAGRLSEHRKKWDGVDMTPIPSRQADRAHARWKAKRRLHNAKMAALKAKMPGGAAVVRTTP